MSKLLEEGHEFLLMQIGGKKYNYLPPPGTDGIVMKLDDATDARIQ